LERGFSVAGLADHWLINGEKLTVFLLYPRLQVSRVLQDRVDAVQEILESSSERLVTLRNILRGLPDLAKGLCRIQYGQVNEIPPTTVRTITEANQCTPQELAVLLPAFNKVASAFEDVDTPASVGLESPVLNEIISSFPKLREPIKVLLRAVNLKKASEGKKDAMWTDLERYPGIIDADMVRVNALQCPRL